MPRGYLRKPRREQLCPLSLNLPRFSFLSCSMEGEDKEDEGEGKREHKEEEIMGKCIFKRVDIQISPPLTL